MVHSAQRDGDDAGHAKRESLKRDPAAPRRKMRAVYAGITLLLVVCLIIGALFYSEGFFAGPNARTVSTGGVDDGKSLGGTVKDNAPKAVVIDALSEAGAYDEFDDSVNRTLRQAGFAVDVYQGSKVTVDFLEKFQGDYKLVIFRVHSALSSDKQLYLFTAEPYSSEKYSQEQYFLLVKEAYATESSQPVFAVNWGFVKRLMTGDFNGTIVVVMGCDGMDDPLIAKEFCNQGAVGYAAWNGPVLLSHSDEATLHLIEDLYVSKQPLQESVNDTNRQVGGDPASGSTLECYVP
jgi:hypothetical protein